MPSLPVAYVTALAGLHTIGHTGKHHRRLEKNGATYGIASSRGGKELAFSGGNVWRARADGSHLRTMRPNGHDVRRAFTFPARNSIPRNVAWQTR
jgi:hypothetical protein